MQKCLDEGKKLRPISSGWSWNKCIEADADAVNVVLCGSLSTYFNMDVVKQKCVVAGGMMISDFVGWCEQQQLDLAWAPKGGCYSSWESQCFAGFVATNVHHHNTST